MSDYMPEDSGQGDAGESGESQEFNSDSTAGESGGGQTGYNPNWDEAFNGLPPEFHEKLKPVFTKWDQSSNQRYEQVQQRYSPYEILAENEVSIDDVRQAFELRNQISRTPQEVFGRLAAHLGYDISKLNQNGDEGQGLNEYSDNEDEDPRIAELKRQNEGILNYLDQRHQHEENQRLEQEQAQQESQWFDETKSTLDTLESKYGKFDRNRVVQFALWEAESKGTDVNLEDGIRAMQEFTKTAIQGSANASAPQVFSGNGALVSGRVDTSKMNDAEFQKYAVERIRAKNAANGG